LDAANSVEDFENIVKQYGTHAIYSVKTGGRLMIKTRQSKCAASTSLGSSVSAEANHGLYKGSGSIEVDAQEREEKGIESKSVVRKGGTTSSSFEEWEQSLMEPSNRAAAWMALVPLDLFVSASKSGLWREALERTAARTSVPATELPARLGCTEPSSETSGASATITFAVILSAVACSSFT